MIIAIWGPIPAIFFYEAFNSRNFAADFGIIVFFTP